MCIYKRIRYIQIFYDVFFCCLVIFAKYSKVSNFIELKFNVLKGQLALKSLTLTIVLYFIVESRYTQVSPSIYDNLFYEISWWIKVANCFRKKNSIIQGFPNSVKWDGGKFYGGKKFYQLLGLWGGVILSIQNSKYIMVIKMKMVQ